MEGGPGGSGCEGREKGRDAEEAKEGKAKRLTAAAARLTEGHNNGAFGSPCVADSLEGLWHNGVIGRDNEDDNVCDGGASCPHGTKGRVTRGVEKGEAGAALRQ